MPINKSTKGIAENLEILKSIKERINVIVEMIESNSYDYGEFDEECESIVDNFNAFRFAILYP